jgi:hypothetical protein
MVLRAPDGSAAADEPRNGSPTPIAIEGGRSSVGREPLRAARDRPTVVLSPPARRWPVEFLLLCIVALLFSFVVGAYLTGHD